MVTTVVLSVNEDDDDESLEIVGCVSKCRTLSAPLCDGAMVRMQVVCWL